jgi:N-acetylmuramoyl-L-alanine amidase
LCITLLLSFSVLQAGNGFEIKTVVIDAGHGGKDPGAIGPGKTYEKDVALAVALKLGEAIKKAHPGVNVIYTRKTDVFLELHERAEIANKNKADLFIAVHINSSTNPQAYGSSCYVLGLHKTEANLEVAKRENAVILLEEDRDKNYDFDPNTPEGHIIMSMKQNAFLEQSISMASKVEEHMENSAKRKSLGVKQAGFYVLYKTAMPSILAEIGFISNPEEEKFLKSEAGQEKIGNALFKAFAGYKAEMEGSEGEQFVYEETRKQEATKKNDSAAVIQAAKNVVKEEPKKETKIEPKKTTEPEVAVIKEDNNYVTLPTGKKVRKPSESASGGGSAPVKKEEPAPVAVKNTVEEPVKEQPKKEEPKPGPATTEQPKKEEPKKEVKPAGETIVNKAEPKPETATTAQVLFKIQLFALKGELTERAKIIQLFKEISTENLPNGLTRYYGGKTTTYSQAQKLLQTAKENGYTSAFIVGYKNGIRMNSEEMKPYINQ